MRILFLSSFFPRPYAPIRGIYCQHICSNLAAQDEVSVISPRSWIEALKHPTIDAPRVDGAFLMDGLPTRYPTYLYPPKIMRTAYGRFMWESVRRGVTNYIRDWAPDAVLSYWAHPDGEVAARAAAITGVPCAVIVGGSDVLLLMRNASRRRSVVSALTRADAVLAVSQDLRRKITDLGVDDSKVHVVHTGVDTKLFYPADKGLARERLGIARDGKIVLFVGNLLRLKGLDVLLRSMSLLGAGVISPHVYLIGAGPERAALEAQARHLQLADKVHFVGAIRQPQLPDWYRAADVTVLPSRSEGIPNVLRESLACGTPFVATRVGGIPEISVAPRNRLVEVDDVDGLASALRRTLTDTCLEGSAFEAPPTWPDTAAHCRRIFENLLSHPTPHRKRQCAA
jgi:glycosyltransferase involved in cell wall biosynthesis